jgi:hypothetical protein
MGQALASDVDMVPAMMADTNAKVKSPGSEPPLTSAMVPQFLILPSAYGGPQFPHQVAQFVGYPLQYAPQFLGQQVSSHFPTPFQFMMQQPMVASGHQSGVPPTYQYQFTPAFQPSAASGIQSHVAAGIQPYVVARTQPYTAARTQPNVVAGIQPNAVAGIQPYVATGMQLYTTAGAQPNATAGIQADVRYGTHANIVPEADPQPQPEASVPGDTSLELINPSDIPNPYPVYSCNVLCSTGNVCMF